MGVLDRIGWSLTASGLGVVLAAVVCQLTGTHAATSGGDVVNTHTPATWVLSVLGAVLFVNGAAVLSAVGSHAAASDRS